MTLQTEEDMLFAMPMKMKVQWWCLSLALFLLSGCGAVNDYSSGMLHMRQGERYLEENAYDEGKKYFQSALANNPDRPEVYYYYGRLLLADNEYRHSLPYLEKAVELAPAAADYHFWLGVAYGATGREEKEKKFYHQTLILDPGHIGALTYLGNSNLRASRYEKALEYYQKAIDLSRSNPQALYNRALILHRLERVPEEKLAWLSYLNAYPSGAFARHAANRLNSLDDHSYRNHRLGARTLTLSKIGFTPFSSRLASHALPSLDLVGQVVSNMEAGVLQIVVYQLNNKELAKGRALSIRDYLHQAFPELQRRERIRVSWFDVAEKRTVFDKTVTVDESVQFFLTDVQ